MVAFRAGIAITGLGYAVARRVPDRRARPALAPAPAVSAAA